jgi:hypothetical protein
MLQGGAISLRLLRFLNKKGARHAGNHLDCDLDFGTSRRATALVAQQGLGLCPGGFPWLELRALTIPHRQDNRITYSPVDPMQL